MDCLDEGLTIARGVAKLTYKTLVYDEPVKTEMDWGNLLEMTAILASRCNYHATVEGMVLSRMLYNHINSGKKNFWHGFLKYTWLTWEIAINLVDDIVVIGIAGMSFWNHIDLFNSSLIIGKVMKICLQLYLEGFAFQFK